MYLYNRNNYINKRIFDVLYDIIDEPFNDGREGKLCSLIIPPIG